MSEKLTPKQEKFAQGVASGMAQADAYRAAFDCKRATDKSIHELASRMAAKVKVRSRVEILRAPVIAKVRYELENAMVEANRALAMAEKLENPAAMARVVELKAKLNGLMVEDRKNQRRPLEELTDDQLEARIERLTGGAQPSVH